MDTIIHAYLNEVKQTCPKITEEALEYLGSGVTTIELGVRDLYIDAGVVQTGVAYVHSGLVRSFYIDKKGNEVTTNFIDEKKYFVDYPSYRRNEPSKFYYQSIEATTLVNIPKEHIDNCVDKYPLIDRYIRLMVEEVYGYMFNRLESLLFSSAEERYLNFITESPNLFNRVPISQLCSYLGMERQSLTRIRHKLAKNDK